MSVTAHPLTVHESVHTPTLTRYIMKKVAKLVAVSFLTRVVVKETATEEEVLKEAKIKFQDKLDNNELADNLEYIDPDEECPYGTFQGET